MEADRLPIFPEVETEIQASCDDAAFRQLIFEHREHSIWMSASKNAACLVRGCREFPESALRNLRSCSKNTPQAIQILLFSCFRIASGNQKQDWRKRITYRNLLFFLY